MSCMEIRPRDMVYHKYSYNQPSLDKVLSHSVLSLSVQDYSQNPVQHNQENLMGIDLWQENDRKTDLHNIRQSILDLPSLV